MQTITTTWKKDIRKRKDLLELINFLFKEKKEYTAKEIADKLKKSGKLKMKFKNLEKSLGGILREESEYTGELKYSPYTGYKVTVWRHKK